jgi:hydroxymethylpyrimidine/phosphomethylpyrimidine kinase
MEKNDISRTDRRSVPRALTIAGSDSGGCAGVQADLKTFGALGVHGMSVITAVTAQNTREVLAARGLPLRFIELQMEAVLTDIGVDAAKTGMLFSSRIVRAVAAKIREFAVANLVVDPVMVATSGARLIRDDAVAELRRSLLPLATVVTPNLREAEVLLGRELVTDEDIERAAAEIRGWGPAAVIIKGGHRVDPARAVDFYDDGRTVERLDALRIPTPHTHGSGCTFAAAITAFLARGLDPLVAARNAKAYVTEAIRNSFPIGRGSGPLGHFFELWSRR